RFRDRGMKRGPESRPPQSRSEIFRAALVEVMAARMAVAAIAGTIRRLADEIAADCADQAADRRPFPPAGGDCTYTRTHAGAYGSSAFGGRASRQHGQRCNGGEQCHLHGFGPLLAEMANRCRI